MPLRELLFSFDGRIRRRDWWLASIAISVGYTALSGILSQLIIGPDAYSMADAFAGVPPVTDQRQTLINLGLAVLLLWPRLALAAKRAHDRDRGARLAIGIVCVSTVEAFVPGTVSDLITLGWGGTPFEIARIAFSFAVFCAELYLLITLGFLDGTPGPNRFGPSPKGIGGDPADKAAEVFS